MDTPHFHVGADGRRFEPETLEGMELAQRLLRPLLEQSMVAMLTGAPATGLPQAAREALRPHFGEVTFTVQGPSVLIMRDAPDATGATRYMALTLA